MMVPTTSKLRELRSAVVLFCDVCRLTGADRELWEVPSHLSGCASEVDGSRA